MLRFFFVNGSIVFPKLLSSTFFRMSSDCHVCACCIFHVLLVLFKSCEFSTWVRSALSTLDVIRFRFIAAAPPAPMPAPRRASRQRDSVDSSGFCFFLSLLVLRHSKLSFFSLAFCRLLQHRFMQCHFISMLFLWSIRCDCVCVQLQLRHWTDGVLL